MLRVTRDKVRAANLSADAEAAGGDASRAAAVMGKLAVVTGVVVRHQEMVAVQVAVHLRMVLVVVRLAGGPGVVRADFFLGGAARHAAGNGVLRVNLM